MGKPADAVLGQVIRETVNRSLATLSDAKAVAGTSVLALAAPKLSHATAYRKTTQKITGAGFAAKEKVRLRLSGRPAET